jgi:hypothetical protein
MNALICPAKRTDADFQILYDFIGQAPLMFTGMAADGAQFAHSGQGAI